MQKGIDLRSPLTVIYMTIVLLTLTGALIMVTVVLEWLPPVWSWMVLLLQTIALLVLLMAYRWRPSWRLWFYPVVIAYMTLLWNMTPPGSTEEVMHVSLPLALVIGIIGDLVVTWWQSLPFTPGRISIHGGYVNFDEVAHFSVFRRMSCACTSRTWGSRSTRGVAAKNMCCSMTCWQSLPRFRKRVLTMNTWATQRKKIPEQHETRRFRTTNSVVDSYAAGIFCPYEPPCVLCYQPTHRHHSDGRQDPIRLCILVKALVDRRLLQATLVASVVL
jgi:hypothetical protein